MLKGFQGGAIFAEFQPGGDSLVVFLHGWDRDHSDFALLKGLLSDSSSSTDMSFLSFDLPGFGASPAPSQGVGSETYGQILNQAIAEHIESDPTVSRIVILGHSFGGRVLTHMLSAWTDLRVPLVGAVMSGVPFFRPATRTKPAIEYRVVRSLFKSGLVTQSILEKYQRQHGSADYNNTSGVMREVFVRVVNEDYTDQLKAISTSIRLVWGEKDTQAPVEMAERANSILLDSSLLVLRECGHMVPLLRPQDLANQITDLVRAE